MAVFSLIVRNDSGSEQLLKPFLWIRCWHWNWPLQFARPNLVIQMGLPQVRQNLPIPLAAESLNRVYFQHKDVFLGELYRTLEIARGTISWHGEDLLMPPPPSNTRAQTVWGIDLLKIRNFENLKLILCAFHTPCISVACRLYFSFSKHHELHGAIFWVSSLLGPSTDQTDPKNPKTVLPFGSKTAINKISFQGATRCFVLLDTDRTVTSRQITSKTSGGLQNLWNL